MVVQLKDDTIYLNGEKTNEKIEYKGVRPKGGYVMIAKDGKTSMAIYNDVYCAYKNEYDEDVSVKKINDPSECTLN